MARHEQNRVDALDRQWDRYLSDVQSGLGNGGELERIARLHSRDDTPGPPDDFRQRLYRELQEMFPHQTARQDGATVRIDDPDEDPAPPAAPGGGRGLISRAPSPRARQWGELAAMLLVLILVTVGALLYGDDVYDFAQRQIATDPDDAAISDERETLEANGEVDGLTFEQAQALTPFELSMPNYIPDELSEGEFEVLGQPFRTASGVDWTFWSASGVFAIDEFDLEPLRITMQPTWEHLSIPLPREVDVEGVDEPAGHLDVVRIDDSGVVRSEEFTADGEMVTHYLWRQGNVDIWIQAPFGAEMSEEQKEWVDVLDAPINNDDVERMIASVMEQGPLYDGADEIDHRGLTLDQTREWLSTAPLPGEVPEQLELTSADAWMNGPTMFLQHQMNDAIYDIWVRAISGNYHAGLQGHIEDIGGETSEVNGVSVTRYVLPEPDAQEVSEYMLAVGLHADLLLPWFEQWPEHGLVTYVWSVAGMGFIMGVEVDTELIESGADGRLALTDDAPESDWLELINAQRMFADEHLDPEVLFPVLAREATAEDELPEQDMIDADDFERVRLLGEIDDARYYLGERTDNQGLVVMQMIGPESDGYHPMSAGGTPLWHAAQEGIGTSMSGADIDFHVAYVLPVGYDEVVDENGDVLGEVDNNLFAMSVASGDPRPSEMIARGPAGELRLDL